MTMLEGLIQASLFLLIFWQFKTIRTFANDAFGHDETKHGRFWGLINDALNDHKINLKLVFQSAILLPITFAAPRLAEALADGTTVSLTVSTVAETIHELAKTLFVTT
jgi:hypothetical protein